MVKILDSTYAKENLKQVVDIVNRMNYEERTQLLSLYGDFEDLFCGTLGYWVTEPSDL